MDGDFIIPIDGKIDIDKLMDEMGHAQFIIEPYGDGVMFEARMKRLRTPRGRVLVPVEDVVGFLDAQVEAGGDLVSARRLLVNMVMDDEVKPAS